MFVFTALFKSKQTHKNALTLARLRGVAGGMRRSVPVHC